MPIVEQIARKMLLKPSFLLEIAEISSFSYKKFSIKKRNGNERIVYEPAKELKSIQRIILDNIFVKLPIHQNVLSYKKGVSITETVKVHAKSKYFLSVDLKNFFYSIKKEDIRNYFIHLSKNGVVSWDSDDIEFLLKICCFHNSLVIGSVTSPILSNAICHEMDNIILSICLQKKVNYTRYSDDLIFSTDEAYILYEFVDLIKDILKIIPFPKNLMLNYSKIHHSSRKKQVKILGLIITNQNHISLGHQKKEEIKKRIYKWTSLSEAEKSSLQGTIAFSKSVEPSFINRLSLKYGSEKINQIMKYNRI